MRSCGKRPAIFSAPSPPSSRLLIPATTSVQVVTIPVLLGGIPEEFDGVSVTGGPLGALPKFWAPECFSWENEGFRWLLSLLMRWFMVPL